MSTIDETHILECNRLHSIEYKSNNNNNPATWQNVVGPLDVKKGDTIELHSAFIGERGCSTLNAIEFKGSKISEDKHTITYTEIKKSILGDTRLYIDNPFGKWEVSTITEDVEQFDNKANIVIGFYKNSNLENTMFLPRKFAYDSTDIAKSYSDVDGSTYGVCFKPITGSYISYDYGLGVYNSATNNNTIVKPISDNSRFTCLIRLGTNYVNFSTGASFLDDYKDPALCEYDYYREKIELNVDKGFNGADDIANILSQQLTATKRQETFYSTPDYAVSITYETPTYKPMLCANSAFKKSVFTSWQSGTVSSETIRYNNAYQFIWCKRPDFFLGGRKLIDRGGFQLAQAITKVGAVEKRTDNQPIVLDAEFTLDNLDKLNAYFKIQKKNWYDFFWNNHIYYMNVKDNQITTPYARFLHMNLSKNASMTDPAVLGSDSYESSDNLLDVLQSVPIFFAFNENYEDIKTSGYQTEKPFYGFATRTNILGVEYITLHPNIPTTGSGPIGIPNSFIVDNTLEIGRRIGHDYHFSAYGSQCLSTFSGYLPTDQGKNFVPGFNNGTKAVPIDESMDHLYLGASRPLISYENDHFNISLLHNPENIGQIDFTVGDSVKNNPIVDTASDTCYRLNKRVANNQYCPDAKPYEVEVPITNGSIYQINTNAVPFKIFDSFSGIFIEDFGYNEIDHKNGLWGIMGFSYNQFNSEETEKNLRNSRITDNNVYNLKFPTTNALIVSSSNKTYTQNPYNGGLFTNQLPVPYYDTAKTIGIYPAIIITPAQSMKLVSENLPRKMLKPYYTIRSSIIPYLNYIGAKNSNTLLPVIGVVNKINGTGDFYSETSSNMNFIANKNFTVNNIYTSIHDPDGTFATVSLDSCILIKIIKSVEMVDAVQQIIAEKEQKK